MQLHDYKTVNNLDMNVSYIICQDKTENYLHLS